MKTGTKSTQRNEIIEMAEIIETASMPTWGIASLRQTTDFTPGYMAERACRE
jgi:hypothetical protein